MDPIAVGRTVWRHRWLAFPVVLLTIAAAVYVTFWGPRAYDSSASYVLINPKLPSSDQIEADPALAGLNSDNPYLRASDPSLTSQVVISKLNSESTVMTVAGQGLSSDYLAAPGNGIGGTAIITITASGDNPAKSLATTEFLGQQLFVILRDIQKINGADDIYLIKGIKIVSTDVATERVSSRLRTIVVVALGGLIVLFGTMSFAQARSNSKARKVNDSLVGVVSDSSMLRSPKSAKHSNGIEPWSGDARTRMGLTDDAIMGGNGSSNGVRSRPTRLGLRRGASPTTTDDDAAR